MMFDLKKEIATIKAGVAETELAGCDPRAAAARQQNGVINPIGDAILTSRVGALETSFMRANDLCTHMKSCLETLGMAIPQGAQEVAHGFRGVGERIAEFEARISQCESQTQPISSPLGIEFDECSYNNLPFIKLITFTL